MLCYKIHSVTPQLRILEKVVDLMKNHDGVAIYPTDTVYGMGACVHNHRAVNRIAEIINRDKMRLFSFICSDFSQVSHYAKMSNVHYKLMKQFLPGPYTFILPATSMVPKKICPKRKTVGIRIPDNRVCIELIKLLKEPLANTSLSIPGEERGNPDNFQSTAISNQVDVILDAGKIENPIGSTIIDLLDETPRVIRMGKGSWYER